MLEVSFVHMALRVIKREYEPMSERKQGVYCKFAFETESCDRSTMFPDSNSHKTESRVETFLNVGTVRR